MSCDALQLIWSSSRNPNGGVQFPAKVNRASPSVTVRWRGWHGAALAMGEFSAKITDRRGIKEEAMVRIVVVITPCWVPRQFKLGLRVLSEQSRHPTRFADPS
ncbi:unnamed protein product [Lampetra planeri]